MRLSWYCSCVWFEACHDVDEFTSGFPVHVDFISVKRSYESRSVCAVVDEFDAVDVTTFASGIAPPFETFVPFDCAFNANFQSVWNHVASPNSCAEHIFWVMRRVHDRSWVVCHAWNDCDVWVWQLQHNCVAVHNHDRTLKCFVGFWIDQGGHTARH